MLFFQIILPSTRPEGIHGIGLNRAQVFAGFERIWL